MTLNTEYYIKNVKPKVNYACLRQYPVYSTHGKSIHSGIMIFISQLADRRRRIVGTSANNAG